MSGAGAGRKFTSSGCLHTALPVLFMGVYAGEAEVFLKWWAAHGGAVTMIGDWVEVVTYVGGWPEWAIGSVRWQV